MVFAQVWRSGIPGDGVSDFAPERLQISVLKGLLSSELEPAAALGGLAGHETYGRTDCDSMVSTGGVDRDHRQLWPLGAHAP